MTRLKLAPIEIGAIEAGIRPRYSVCTLVTNPDEYQAMLASFAEAGFDGVDCEFLYADNSQGNRYDGYAAINRFLRVARGEYIVLCHQDIRLHDDRIEALDLALAELHRLDPHWAAAGNAGGVRPGRLAIRITDPNGQNTRLGSFPARVASLDENFIVVRRDAGLSVSHNLTGFHFYGTDLCLIAEVLGYRCYAIDFHLWHIGGGSQSGKSGNAEFRSDYPAARKRLNAEFRSDYPAARKRLIEKYRRVFAARWLQNTGGTLFLSGSSLLNTLGNRKLVLSLVRRFHRIRID